MLFEQPGEEFLGQVLCVLDAAPAPSHIGVKRIPVGPAKNLQSVGSSR